MTNIEEPAIPVDNGLPQDDRPVPLKTVVSAEKKEIDARRCKFGIKPHKEQKCPERDFLGLAISGGGIRSATFSLGIIQMLAKFGLLKHVDYLSTVSGGGYIGAWLYSWIRRDQADERPSAANAAPARYPEKVFENINSNLAPQKTPEPQEIAFLREYSNYLTPRMSVFNADTWLIAAVWSRNTLLNLAILVAFFGLAVLLIRGIGLHADQMLWPGNDNSFGAGIAVCAGLLIPMILLIGKSLWKNSTIALNNAPPENRNNEASDTSVICFCIFPLLSAIAYSFWLDHARCLFVDGTLFHGVWANFAVLSIAYLFLQFCSRVYKCHVEKQKEITGNPSIHFWDRAFAVILYVVGPAAAGFVTAALLRAIAFVFDTRYLAPDESWFVLTWGPPLVLIAFAVGVVVHVGVMGRDLPEASREWLSRLRAWLMIFSFFWIVIFGVSIYGPWLVAWIGVKSSVAIGGLGGGWLLTTAGALFAGKSAKTSGKKEKDSTQTSRASVFEILARIGPYLFMAGFAISVAYGVHVILVHDLKASQTAATASQVEKYDLKVRNDNIQLARETRNVEDSGFQWVLSRYWFHLNATELLVSSQNRWLLSGLLPLFGLLAVAGLLLAWRVDINNFSMHNFYKSRLVRCYLGASRLSKRRPSPFTGFDDFDDAPLDLFTYKQGYFGPYPIVNAALNVTSGGKLQYQERQAQSFIFTPHFTGFSAETVVDQMRLLDDTETDAESLQKYQTVPDSDMACAYRPTRFSGGRVGVGMAMAVSGAAVNPNMGYHSSTAVAFLLTVFNVRLGWWLGNSLKSSFKSQGPPFGLIYSFRELLGLANADSRYVNLSDGGHFENMGIYELVRRKCPYIICCDGEQDANLTFGGIGMAIRKCRTDFGVEIDLPLYPLHKVDDLSRVHCAVGRIKYPPSDPPDPSDPKEDGYIVYLKATLTGDEPVDVLAYHSDQPEFPHQTTGDQWFDESQFESYRRLGCHVAGKALSSSTLQGNDRQKFFCDLYQVWYPPSKAVDRHSAYHADIYMRILDYVRRDPDLSDLDEALFKDYKEGGFAHAPGHICNGLTQLMERVFYDLGLEDNDERNHPYIQGWLNIFDHWVNQDAFIKAWAVTKGSYPRRFQEFYESRVRGKPPDA